MLESWCCFNAPSLAVDYFSNVNETQVTQGVCFITSPIPGPISLRMAHA